MIRLQSLLAASVLGLTLSTSALAGTFTIDTAHSMAIFKIGHQGIGNIYGRFNNITGTFTTNATGQLVGADVTIQATTVDTAVTRRDDHLRSADFLNVAQFPTIKFVSTAVAALDNNTYELTGNFTLHGVTKEVTLQVEQVGSGTDQTGHARIGAEGRFAIRRSDYGMTGLPTAAGDDVGILLAFEGFQQ